MEPTAPGLAATSAKAGVQSIVVTTADGRAFDLGRPDSKLFKARLRLYKIKRRKEL